MKLVNEFYVRNNQYFKVCDFKESTIIEGKSIYEVIRVIEGELLFYKEHEERVINSINLLGESINNEEELKSQIRNNCDLLLKVNEHIEGNIKVIVNLHDNNIEILSFYIPHKYPSKEMYEDGVKTILVREERDNPNAKIVNEDFKARINEKLLEQDAYEAILINKKGEVTEGSKSNIFFIIDDVVVTSKVDKVLPGITRMKVLEVMEENNIAYEERIINEDELINVSGAFITGTSPKVLPVRDIKDLNISLSENKIISSILELFDKKIEESIKR